MRRNDQALQDLGVGQRQKPAGERAAIKIAESNIQKVTEKGVLFIAKVYPGENTNPNGRPRDHKKIEKPVLLDLRSFIKRITNHLPERYRHNVRYFGLFAPRLRRIAQTVIETNIPDSVAPEAANQATQRLWPPKDSRGNAMRRIRSVSPQEFERRQKPGRNR